jgi:hypothetical protein
MTFCTENTVRPELVEGLSFSCAAEKKGQGFDKLSPNGLWVSDVPPSGLRGVA